MSATKVSQSTLIVSTVTALYLITSGSSIIGSRSESSSTGTTATTAFTSASFLVVSAAAVSKTTSHSSAIVVSNWWIFFLAALIGLTLSLCLVLTICTCRSFCSSFTSCDTEVCSDDDSDSMICFSQQHPQQQSHDHSVPINSGGGSSSTETSQLTQIFVGNNTGTSSDGSYQGPEEKQCLLSGESGSSKGRRIIGLRTVVVDS